MKRIGMIRKKFLTRERIQLIIDHLLRTEKRRHWSPSIRREWHALLQDRDGLVERIYWALRYQNYEYAPFIRFTRRERGKLREIYASRPTDQIVDQLLTDCLLHVFTERKQLIPKNCYGSLKGRGQHAMRRKIIRLVHGRKDLYVGVCDTKQYYPTMSHEILYKQCERHIKDRWLLWLCKITIERMQGGKGLALGSPSSNILGHVYHADLDWEMILGCQARRYFRFCDNKFFIHTDKQYIHTLIREMRKGIEALGQQMKSDWRVVRCDTERFDCLGAMVNGHNARMHPKTRRHAEHVMQSLSFSDPETAMRSWSGIRGTFHSLSAGNLLRYWRDRFLRFFDLVEAAQTAHRENARRKRWHRKLGKILTLAADCRSEQYKTLYPISA